MTARPAATTGVRAREMKLYRRYFDLVAAGRKTIEVRVQYPNLRKLAAGDHIRFVCGRDDALTVIKRVTRYRSFEEMLDGEGPEKINPDSPRDLQLANIRRIYGPEKESLGVLAIEIDDDTVPDAAALLRELAARRDRPPGRPSWFGALRAGPDFAERSEEILRVELGRPA